MLAETTENRRAPNKYDSFFIAGTYLMVPELLHPSAFSTTKSMVRMGLILDDCWDFGIDRHEYAGQFITQSQFPSIVDPSLATVYQQERAKTFDIIASSGDSEFRDRQRVNLERFETGIMQTEAVALAIPYTPDYWNVDLVDKYRSTDARIWGAMMVALIPNSGLNLPEVPITPVTCPTEAKVSLEAIYDDYCNYLLSAGPSGRLAMALTAEMMFVQIQMDMFDRYINQGLGSPAFSAFGDSREDLRKRSLDYLSIARTYSPRRMTPSRIVSRSFPLVYKILADSSDWRDIKGWKNIRHAEV